MLRKKYPLIYSVFLNVSLWEKVFLGLIESSDRHRSNTTVWSLCQTGFKALGFAWGPGGDRVEKTQTNIQLMLALANINVS